MISARIYNDIPPQMKILNMVIPIGQVGMTSLQVNWSQAEVNASVFIPVF